MNNQHLYYFCYTFLHDSGPTLSLPSQGLPPRSKVTSLRCGDSVWGLGAGTRCRDCGDSVLGLTVGTRCWDSVWGLGVGIVGTRCGDSVLGLRDGFSVLELWGLGVGTRCWDSGMGLWGLGVGTRCRCSVWGRGGAGTRQNASEHVRMCQCVSKCVNVSK